jgi:hypothetical protein
MTTLAIGAKPEEALKAFQTIFAEMEKVRPLNYRSRLFTNWKSIVQTALARFLGADHPSTAAFAGLVFHGPMPKSPMDPPVSQKDIEGYENAMAATTKILEELIASLSSELPAPAAAIPPPPASIIPPPPPGLGTPAAGSSIGRPSAMAFPPPPPPAPAADTGFRLTRGTSDAVVRFSQEDSPVHGLGSPDTSGTTHDLQRHSGSIPEGGLKIVSRSGVSAATTLDQYLANVTDSIERELVTSLRDAMNDPDIKWEVIKNLLAELWWQKKENFQKILPIILRR